MSDRPDDSTEDPAIVEYSVDQDESVSRAVIEAVAAATNSIPADVNDEPLDELDALYEAVDPDALDAFFRSSATADPAGGEVTFLYADCRVTIDAGETIVVRPLE